MKRGYLILVFFSDQDKFFRHELRNKPCFSILLMYIFT